MVQLETAIASQSILHILYCSATASQASWRPVQLDKWLNKPFAFSAVCVKTNTRKTYRTDRVSDVSVLPRD